MTVVVIAEKSNMATKIAEALGVPKIASKPNVYGNDQYRIVSCEGHILEDFEPHDYDEALKSWNIQSLPIIPTFWKQKIDNSRKHYVERIKQELLTATTVIHGGDPDPVGQSIINDVLIFLGWKGVTKRVLINDLNPQPIRNAFNKLEDNDSEKFNGMYRRALARRRGDWILGLNLTRLYTKLGQEFYPDIVLSAGRVQSAILGLIVKRHNAIKNFRPIKYYPVRGLAGQDSSSFPIRLKLNANDPGADEEGRLVDINVARAICSSAPLDCTVESYDSVPKKQSPPLPFSMSELQKTCSEKLALTMQEVLDICQKLYEKHGLVTYPRSDTGYLPENHHDSASEVLTAIQGNSGFDFIANADPAIKSSAFSDRKVADSAHHGIIPTANESPSAIASLSITEKNVYDIICIRYISQFFPPALFQQTKVFLKSESGYCFTASGRVYKSMGWRVLPGMGVKKEQDDDEEIASTSIPALEVGQQVNIASLTAEEKETKPPKPYTDASLLSAMTGIDKHVSNKEIAKLLKNSKGIGTEATRANIVEKLIQHKLVVRESKNFAPTEIGERHYTLMPAEITEPDMAGIFELKTYEIEKGTLQESQFISMLENFVKDQISGADNWIAAAQKLGVKKTGKECRYCKKILKAVKSKSTQKKFFACGNCDSLFENNNSHVGFCFKGPLHEQDLEEREKRRAERLKDAPPCSVCSSPVLKVKTAKGKRPFWACQEPDCKAFFSDFNNAPGPMFSLKGQPFESKPDGNACPNCNTPMHRRSTVKLMPYLHCTECDSMAWFKKGKVGNWFKFKGELVKNTQPN